METSALQNVDLHNGERLVMKQLKPQDAQFLLMEDGRLASHITSIWICDQSTAPNGLVRFKEILSTVENRLGNAPLYSQKLMRLPFNVDFPYWVEDPHFDLEYHVRHNRLPEPADWRQLCIYIARLHSRPLDMSRPPWEIFVIEGLDNVEGYAPGSFAVVMKMHHAAVDGTSAQEFMFSMLDFGPQGPPIIPATSQRRLVRERPPAKTQLLARAAFNNAVSPLKLANAARKMAPSLAKAAARRVINRNDDKLVPPKTRFNGDVSPNRAFDAVSFDLATFRKVAATFENAKINDVVLAVCGGALRTYLKSKNELPETSLVITAPVNKRGGDGSSRESDGNNISAMSVPIYTNIANPQDRLKSIILASQAAKSAKSGLLTRVVTDLSQYVSPLALAALGPVLVANGGAGENTGNAIVSNVPGLQKQIYFCGAKIVDMYAMAPIGAGLGLFIATPSYNGRLTFNITTTRQMMPDTSFFIQCLKDALDELITIAEARQTLRATPKTRQRKTYHRTRPKKTGASAPAIATSKPEPKTPKPKKTDTVKPAGKKPKAKKPSASRKKSGKTVGK